MKKTIFNFILFVLLGVIASFVLPDVSARLWKFAQRTQSPATTTLSQASTSTSPMTSGTNTATNTKKELPQTVSSPVAKTAVSTPASKAATVPTIEKTTPVQQSAEPGALIVTRPPQSAPTTPLAPSAVGKLNQQGILTIVNSEREKQGLPPLTFNKTLTVMADVKAVDMIARQYFAHVAPDGTDVAKLAERYGYDYLRIGENLAMGDFVSNADVMDGWMNSPGHRANILNSEYTEIGISAQQGVHDGRLMWYAVQEFGRPASLCPSPDVLLAKKITLYEEQLATLEKTMTTLREEIAAAEGDQATYNAKAKDYNTIVDLYNSIVTMTKEAVKIYNAKVEQYNICING